MFGHKREKEPIEWPEAKTAAFLLAKKAEMSDGHSEIVKISCRCAVMFGGEALAVLSHDDTWKDPVSKKPVYVEAIADESLRSRIASLDVAPSGEQMDDAVALAGIWFLVKKLDALSNESVVPGYLNVIDASEDLRRAADRLGFGGSGPVADETSFLGFLLDELDSALLGTVAAGERAYFPRTLAAQVELAGPARTWDDNFEALAAAET